MESKNQPLHRLLKRLKGAFYPDQFNAELKEVVYYDDEVDGCRRSPRKRPPKVFSYQVREKNRTKSTPNNRININIRSSYTVQNTPDMISTFSESVLQAMAVSPNVRIKKPTGTNEGSFIDLLPQNVSETYEDIYHHAECAGKVPCHGTVSVVHKYGLVEGY